MSTLKRIEQSADRVRSIKRGITNLEILMKEAATSKEIKNFRSKVKERNRHLIAHKRTLRNFIRSYDGTHLTVERIRRELVA